MLQVTAGLSQGGRTKSQLVSRPLSDEDLNGEAKRSSTRHYWIHMSD